MYYDIQATAGRGCQLRLHAGFTREVVANRLGIDCGYLRHIENGTRGCSVDLFIRIAELYDVSPGLFAFR